MCSNCPHKIKLPAAGTLRGALLCSYAGLLHAAELLGYIVRNHIRHNRIINAMMAFKNVFNDRYDPLLNTL